MDLHPDLIDLLAAFENSGVEYLVIGGWAVSSHSRPRYTKDLDLWIGSEQPNLLCVVEALKDFGAPPALITEALSMGEDEFFFLGKSPARVDILRTIPGVDFREAWARRVRMRWDQMMVNLISIDDLIVAKEAAGRPQDLADAKALRSMRNQKDDGREVGKED
jgi:hypothetical protein